MSEKLDRKTLRNKLLGSRPPFKKEEFTIDMDGDESLLVELRQPSVKERNRLYREHLQVKQERKDGDNNTETEVSTVDDPLNFLIWAAIELTYVPETDERIFERADYDTLVELPAGSFIDELGQAASRLLNVSDTKESELKNSETTTSNAS